MEHIILIGHGSLKKEANNLETIGNLLHSHIHPGCTKGCVKAAYLQFAEPDIMAAIEKSVQSGAKRIVIHPYFLYAGVHVTKDIPETIKRAGEIYPEVAFVYTEPLGVHGKLIEVIKERIEAATSLKPEDIEEKSFEIISEEADFSGFPPEQLPVIKRVIHATADFEFKNTLLFHPDAIKTGIEAIKAGKDVLTDVEMVKAGINKRMLETWGGQVQCHIRSEEILTQGSVNKTRAEMAIQWALNTRHNIGIIAIGNAPTALLKTIDLLKDRASKILVVGVPVGFVNALESKHLLADQGFPFITALSRKGGTPVAVAIVNALLKMTKE